MLVSLRRGYAQLVTSAGQLALLAFALTTQKPAAILACCPAVAALSLFAWSSATRRARAIGDTPTSRVASAAQGYTELQGRGLELAGVPVLSPVNGLPCLWYRYRIERRDSDERWTLEGSGESEASFILDDGSGQCLVDPEGAEMLVTRRDSWIRGDRRYTQWTLIRHDPLYALGHFDTKGTAQLELHAAEDVKALLAQWKQDKPGLLQRFDADRDGEIDLAEWEAARAAAAREVARAHREAQAEAQVSVLRRPADGRLFLVSNLDPDRLARRYRRWAVFHVLMFFVGLGGLAYGLGLPR